MKKRLMGFFLVISMVLGLSVSVYAEADNLPIPRPPSRISAHLDDVNI